MANKSCSCPRFFSCFSYFCKRNVPAAISSAEGAQQSSDVPAVGTSLSSDVPAVGTSLSAVDEGDVEVDLDALINHISQLLELIQVGKKSSEKKAKTAAQYLPSTTKSFIKLKDFLSEATNFVKDIVPSEGIKTVARGILQGMGMAHLVTTGLVVVADILERFDDVASNKTECLRLLKEMIFLAKLVKQFKERPQLLEGMDDVIQESTELIVASSIECLSQMKSSKFSKFIFTKANKEDLERSTKLLDVQYKHIYAKMGISLFDAHAYKKAPLSRGYPEHAVGIEEPVKEVTDLLEWGSEENVVAVMLNGFGGIGKTTLADAVFSVLNPKGCKYSKVQLFKNIGSIPDIVDLQRLILKDLMERQESIPDIRTPEDGQRVLGEALENATAFIYIDNVLGGNELQQLLPNDMNKAKKVRLLLTARDINVRRGCPVTVKSFRMRSMSSGEAMDLLKKGMPNGMAGKINSSQLRRLVVGVIRSEDDKPKAYRIVMQDRQKLKGQTFGDKEHYLFAYDSLPETCKDPFLDICSFFNGWDWNTVADIVGESELDTLEKRALVTKGIDGVASVHDVILTIGLQKTEGERFKLTSAREVEELLCHNNEEKCIQAIKGLWLTENNDPLCMDTSKLDLMHSSLRVLALGNSIRVEGKCKKVFEKLVFFQAGIPHPPFDMSKAKELKYLSYGPETLDLSKIPSNLKHIEFHGGLHSHHASEISLRGLRQLDNLRTLRVISFANLRKLPRELGDLVNGLEELSLSDCKSLEELPKSISRLQYLRVLRMDHCSGLKQLPEEFSKLQRLRVLRMDYCSSLEHLTEDFGLLSSLQELNLQECIALQALPTSFETLSSLKLMNLSSCTSLEELPHGLGNLTSLVTLELKGCNKLRTLPETIGQLKLLPSSMDISDCSSLTELPDEFCNLSFITHLLLPNCESLHRLPDRFGELASLKVLNLQKCESLKKLPEGFGLLQFLEELDLGGCNKLEELCNDFHCLSSLRDLSLSGCQCLKKLPENFHVLVSLQRLLLCDCKSLKQLPEDFHLLASLQHLHLHDCPMLEAKCMDNVIKAKTLQAVDIKRSTMLLERWAEIQREGDRSWSFTVFTGQDLSEEEAIKIQKNFLSSLGALLTSGQGEPFHLCDCPLNTSILLMLDRRPDFKNDYPWPLIEDTLNDIQIKFEMIYIGKYFDKLPTKIANKILGHATYNAEVVLLFKSWVETLNSDAFAFEDEHFQLSAKIMGNGKDDKYLSQGKLIAKCEIEEFVLGKCGKYIRLKQLETSQQSDKEILREMFATGEESTDHIFQSISTSHKIQTENSKPFTCGMDELKGKTVLLEIRHIEVCYDIRLESLTQMYNTAKQRLGFEIISIPIVQPSTTFDVFDIFQRFSMEVPWLVLQKPWTIAATVKYFLCKQFSWDEEEDEEAMEDEELKTWYPSVIWIIEPNGRITTYKPFVFSMLDRWGEKSYPFTDEKIEELRKEEWEKQKTISSLEFLFLHLEEVSMQVKDMLLQGKNICLYGGNEGMMEFTCSIRTALRELSDTIYLIYIPSYGWKGKEKLRLTYGTSVYYSPLEKPKMPHAEMEGMHILNLSEHEALRFWTRLSSLKKEICKMDDTLIQLSGLKRLLNSFQKSESWMTLMDKDGEMVTSRGTEIVHELISRDISEGKEKGLLLQGLLHEFEEQEREEESLGF